MILIVFHNLKQHVMYNAYLFEKVFILCKQQYSSPVVTMHDGLKCWKQQYQC